MKLVVDANVLFALANPSSVANAIISRIPLNLVSPDFALTELFKYKEVLVKKSGAKNFDSVINSLQKKVIFVDNSEYRCKIKEVSPNISDPNDVTYLALALKLGIPAWSNDAHFKEQSLVDVFTTRELIELLEIRESK